jgi:hypothetical protein
VTDPKDTGKNERDEPVSLAPLDPEEALRGLLAVKPDEQSDESEDDAGRDSRC